VAKLHATADVAGEHFAFSSFNNSDNQLCASQDVPGSGTASGCFNRSSMFTDGRAVFALPGARQHSDNSPHVNWDDIWVYGWVRGDVARLQLLTAGCDTVDVPFDSEGAFMYVAGNSDIARGKAPLKLIALDASGGVMDTRDVSVSLPSNAQKAGLRQVVPNC
jgi:hypothetical protein